MAENSGREEFIPYGGPDGFYRVDHALKLGSIEAACVLNKIVYWINWHFKNDHLGFYHDGTWWMEGSIKYFRTEFETLTESKIRAILRDLRNRNYLRAKKIKTSRGENENYYSIADGYFDIPPEKVKVASESDGTPPMEIPDKVRLASESDGTCVKIRRRVASEFNATSFSRESYALESEREPSEHETLSQIESESPFDTIQDEREQTQVEIQIADRYEDCKKAPPQAEIDRGYLWYDWVVEIDSKVPFSKDQFVDSFSKLKLSLKTDDTKTISLIDYALHKATYGRTPIAFMDPNIHLLETKNGKLFAKTVLSDFEAYKRG